MEKYVSFGIREEIIECNIDITYTDFLGKIQETFNLKEDTYSIIDLTESHFDEMMTVKDNFIIERSEKDLARERLGDIVIFNNANTLQEVEDYLTVYEDGNDDFFGDNALSDAVFNGNTDFVKLILSKNFSNVHKADILGRTPLYWASYKGHTDVVKLLLEKNFENAYFAASDKETPLWVAKLMSHTEIIKLLEEDIARREKEK